MDRKKILMKLSHLADQGYRTDCEIDLSTPIEELQLLYHKLLYEKEENDYKRMCEILNGPPSIGTFLEIVKYCNKSQKMERLLSHPNIDNHMIYGLFAFSLNR